MPLENGKLTLPFNLAEIAKCLGESSEDMGTLCCSEKTNPWSKHKPVRSSSWESSEEVFACDDGNYGFNIASGFVTTTGSGIVTNLKKYYTTDGWNGWAYLRPRSLQPIGVIDRYRMQDFAGYNHNAQAEYTMSSRLEVTEGIALTVTPFKRDFLEDDSILHIKDLQSIHTYDGAGTQFYFGAFVANGSTLVDVAVSDTPITEGISGVELAKVASLDPTTNTTSPYTVYCFLGSEPGTYDDLYGRTMTVITFPLRPATLEINPYVEPVVITAKAAQDGIGGNVVFFSIKVENNGGGLSLANNYIDYYPTGSGTSERITLNDFTVATGKSYTVQARKSDAAVSALSRWSYSLGGGAYSASGLAVALSVSGDITIQ